MFTRLRCKLFGHDLACHPTADTVGTAWSCRRCDLIWTDLFALYPPDCPASPRRVSLDDYGKPPHEARVLVVVDWRDIPTIAATDSEWVAADVDAVSTSAEDVGVVNNAAKECPTPGLYLWSGTLRTSCYGGPDGYEPETEYRGVIRPVRAHEVADLFRMTPPEEEYPDGDAAESGQ